MMNMFAEPPLIEAIFEIRWGKRTSNPNELEFGDDDALFFIGQFQNFAKNKGYVISEPLSDPRLNIQIPHIPTYRFRKEKNKWPCYQIGLGIFTVNQTNDGYSWENFRETIKNGLDLLNEGHPLGLEKIPALSFSLRYIDGFPISNNEKNDSDLNFFNKEIKIGLTLPESLSKSNLLSSDFKVPVIALETDMKTPKGKLSLTVKKAVINGQFGYVLDILTESLISDSCPLKSEDIMTWIDQLKVVQRLAFESIYTSNIK